MSQNWPSADGVRVTAAGGVVHPRRMASASATTRGDANRGVFTPGYYPTSALAVYLVHVMSARLHFGEPRSGVGRRALQEFFPLGLRQLYRMCRVVSASADEMVDERLLEMGHVVFERADVRIVGHASIMSAPARGRRRA